MNLAAAGSKTFQGVIFVIISVIVVAFVGYSAADQRRFVSRARPAKGTVVTMLREHHDNKTRYRPEVEFAGPDGQQIRFRSNTSSSPPAYRVGEAVDVIYDPANPRKAEIDSFQTLWTGYLIGGLMGLLFLVIGGIVAAKGIFALIAVGRLKKNGVLLQTEFQRVEFAGGLNAGTVGVDQPQTPGIRQLLSPSTYGSAAMTRRRSPRYYQIVTLGTDDTGAKREYLSQPLGKDPSSKLMPGMHIGVYVDPQNYGDYYMELKDIV